MFPGIWRLKSKGILIVALLLTVVNAYWIQSPILGTLTLLGVIIPTGELAGPFFLKDQPRWMQTVTGVMSVIALISILGSLLYYLGPVSKTSFVVLMVLVSIASAMVGGKATTGSKRGSLAFPSPTMILTLTAIIIALAAWWTAIAPVRITEAVRTPWDFVDPFAVVAIGIATLLLFGLSHVSKGRTLLIPLVAATFFSAIAMALAIYPLGFGFDSFIHRATVSHIVAFGTITPKPFYYIGQYALELMAVHAFALPLQLVDRLLVPLLAAFFISASAAIGFFLSLKHDGRFALVTILLLPLSAFIVTTPQSLAYVFTAILLFLSLPRLLNKNLPPLWTLFLFAIAALLTHPLAGIPAVIYALMVAVVTWDQPPLLIKRMLATLIVLSGAVALPIVFVIQAKLAQLPVLFSPEGLFDFEKLALTGFFANRFSTWFDGLYLVIANHLWILIVLAAVGLLIAWRHGADKKIHLPLIAAGMWIINYWLLSTTLEFSFLIEYERTNYAERLLIISMLFLIPHVGIALAGIMDHFKARPKILSTSVAILLALMVLANVYGAYPRHDNYARSAGFNVGESDIDAVYAINETGGEQDYIVLANQAVSAAALETFGFKQYYKDDIFYYPIPTGGILYNYYLEMADEGPRRETALEAMDVAGVDLAFFVINDYWWQSEIIREHAKQEADDWFSTGDDAVTVFVYRR